VVRQVFVLVGFRPSDCSRVSIIVRRTPLHCAASCNNLAMVRFLVEHGACIFATTLSDQETAAEKCEEDEEGFDGCSEFLYSEYDLRPRDVPVANTERAPAAVLFSQASKRSWA